MYSYFIKYVFLLSLLLCSGNAFRVTKNGNTHSRQFLLGMSSDPKCGPCPNAPLCSGEYLSKGCDGTGKIQGGIQKYLTFWPIKVFRPCPSYLKAGYQYRREGQTMDQVLFSEPSYKMQEKMKSMRKGEVEVAAKAAMEAIAEKKNVNGGGGGGGGDDKTEGDSGSDEVDRLLSEKFGNKE